MGANKNSIKIIGEGTDFYVQGYYVYDSRKAGAVTVSHLRFGHRPIRSTYLIDRASFIACHQYAFVEQYDMAWIPIGGSVKKCFNGKSRSLPNAHPLKRFLVFTSN